MLQIKLHVALVLDSKLTNVNSHLIVNVEKKQIMSFFTRLVLQKYEISPHGGYYL